MSAKTTRIVLLRGVMPTGKNKVPMATLRDVLSSAGFGNVRSWIQSGNVVLETGLDPEATAATVRRLIREHIGPELSVVVTDAKQLRATLAEQPFADAEPDRVFYTLTMDRADPTAVAELLGTDFGDDRVARAPHGFHLHVPGSMARAKLNNNLIERKLGIAATTRNRNTLSKLIELAEA